ncbi:thylakoid membrane protein TERC, chloroplastic isoform X2 [Tripterygium wilfordii]|uniref:thylakoid membrane protein TERC, chloroplastic isoform X2 n=1 Tax=Tripterygium wilfordii TaxID=458696 RepID=UPI0018F80030|nr:thylakoid membrane protein TERC, chloroplastic isoform X2 [Tripterygium wilfordii]
MAMTLGFIQSDAVLVRASRISSSLLPSSIRPRKCIGVQFSPAQIPTFHAASSGAPSRMCSPIAFSRSEGEEMGSQEHYENEEVSTTGSQTHEASVRGSTFHASHSADKAQEKPQGYKTSTSSIKAVAFCVCTAVAFGIGVGLKDGVDKASEFFAGYILEQSLSVDNLFVFVLVFKYFKVPLMYQNRVLLYGIAGAIIFRLSLILLGTATLQSFEAVNLALAAILLYSSFKLFGGEEDETDLSNNFIVRTCQRFIPVTSTYDGNRFVTKQDGLWKATPLLLTVAVIELSDIAFAVDSIPAVFGVTRDPFIVFSSNLFAILGLRSLYTLISESMAELKYLQCAGSRSGGFGKGKSTGSDARSLERLFP